MLDKNKLLQKFGANLRDARTASAMSQEQLALNADLDRTYVSLLERGKRNPSLHIIALLAHILNVTPSSLLEDVPLIYEEPEE
jgi:transcriptional regulator with XRE-family HTH domain